jgi:hypothetical protein
MSARKEKKKNLYTEITKALMEGPHNNKEKLNIYTEFDLRAKLGLKPKKKNANKPTP